MRVFILDEHCDVLNEFLNWLADDKKIEKISYFNDTDEFIENAKKELPQLVFIKLAKTDISGLKIGNMLKSIDSDIRVVFISEENDHAIEAYNIGAFGYLLTPVEKKKLDKIISIVKEDMVGKSVKQYLDNRGGYRW